METYFTQKIKNIYRRLTSVYWQVALLKHGLPILDKPIINILKFENPQTNWFADPFIFDIRTDEIDIIVEEYIVAKKKGILSLLTVRKSDFFVVSKKKILELDTHLSFPFVFKEKGHIYLFPENSASGSHNIYEYSDNEGVKNVGIAVAEPLVDTAILKIDEIYYLFGTKLPAENGNTLMVYKSSTLIGEYQKFQEIVVNKATARGGSGIYALSSPYHYYRLGQDNEGFYGRGLVFQDITFNPNDNCFTIEEKYRKYPEFADKRIVAMHTYNMMGDLAVIDVKKYKHPILGRVINYLRYHK